MDLTALQSLPLGWTTTTLGAVCSKPQYGWTTKAKTGEGVRLLRTTDISSGTINWQRVPVCTETPSPLEHYLLRENDIVISRAGSVGISYLLKPVPVPSVFASYLIRFRPHFGINPRYIAFYLQSPAYWKMIQEASAGIALANVNASKLEVFSLPLAPLPEQHRIVAEIERQFSLLDAGVANLKRVQANLKRYRAAVLQAACTGQLVPTEAETAQAEGRPYEPANVLLTRILAERRARWKTEQLAKMEAQGKLPLSGAWKAKYQEPAVPGTAGLPELPEGWAWASPEQLASPDNYSLVIGPFGSDLKVSDYRENGVPLVFVRDIRSGVFGGTNTRYVTSEKAERLKAHKVMPGDVLITKMGDPPGDACLYPVSSPPAIATADCIKWALSPILPDARFFVNAVNSHLVKDKILEITKGVAQLKVSLGRFRQIAIPLPPSSEQKRIVAEAERRLSVVDNLEQVVRANLKRAERLRQAVLKEAFAGRLVPQDPADEPAEALLERIKAEREAQAKAPAKAAGAAGRKVAGRKQGALAL